MVGGLELLFQKFWGGKEQCGPYHNLKHDSIRSRAPRPPNVPLLRAFWSLLDDIWSISKASWGVLFALAFEGQCPHPEAFTELQLAEHQHKVDPHGRPRLGQSFEACFNKRQYLGINRFPYPSEAYLRYLKLYLYEGYEHIIQAIIEAHTVTILAVVFPSELEGLTRTGHRGMREGAQTLR